jgi:hypothetical protein
LGDGELQAIYLAAEAIDTDREPHRRHTDEFHGKQAI